jgi:magnesium transporter
MNFEYMPGLKWHWGYPTTIFATAAICLMLYRNFRRNGWL